MVVGIINALKNIVESWKLSLFLDSWNSGDKNWIYISLDIFPVNNFVTHLFLCLCLLFCQYITNERDNAKKQCYIHTCNPN